MIKYIAMWTMNPELSDEQVWELWPHHSQWVKKLLAPELKRYVQHRIIEKLPGATIDFHGLTEMWFDDADSAHKALDRMIAGKQDDFLGKQTSKVVRILAQEIVGLEGNIGNTESSMIKYIALWYVKPEYDNEETWRLWPAHGEWAKAILKPELRRYLQHRIVEKLPGAEADFFGLTEFWFDDVNAAHKALDRLSKSPPDEFMAQRAIPPKVKRFLAQPIEVQL